MKEVGIICNFIVIILMINTTKIIKKKNFSEKGSNIFKQLLLFSLILIAVKTSKDIEGYLTFLIFIIVNGKEELC